MAKKILVIDDEELIIKSLVKLLEKEGYDVFVAKNGQDALAMIEEEQFDLIISDIRMPGINGVDTVRLIHGVLDKLNIRKPPVVFITGFADEETKKEAMTLQPIAFMLKPFDIKELVNKIKAAL
jgi:CheY-like chemotaxis protein